jgi:DNA repair protein RadC
MHLSEASDHPPFSGPRERALVDGIASLGDADLLAVLLGTGLAGRPVSVVAAAILDRFGGVAGLSRIGPTVLSEHPGVGVCKALRVAAALEIGARAARPPSMLPRVANSAEVAALMRPRLGALLHEELWVICLDGRNRTRSQRRVAQGGLHGITLLPCDVLRVALYEAASAFLLVHNHPSGDPSPSPEDMAMTRRVAEAGRAVGIPLVDHVIVCPSGEHRSMLDLGVLQQP